VVGKKSEKKNGSSTLNMPQRHDHHHRVTGLVKRNRLHLKAGNQGGLKGHQVARNLLVDLNQ